LFIRRRPAARRSRRAKKLKRPTRHHAAS
jgi:hypothetical protein